MLVPTLFSWPGFGLAPAEARKTRPPDSVRIESNRSERATRAGRALEMRHEATSENARLEIIERALIERASKLWTGKRLPPGYSLQSLFLEIDVLEAEIASVGRIRSAMQSYADPETPRLLDLTNGAG